MATRLKNLSVTKVALVDAGANPQADVLIYKMADEPLTERVTTVAEDTVAKSDHDTVVAELDSAKAELAALAEMSNDDLAALRGIEVAPVAVDEDDVLKGLPEAVRKRLEDAEDTIAKMQADQRAAEFVAKAAEFTHVAPAADLGPALEQVDRLAPEAAKTIVQALKSAQARIAESGLYAETGTAATADADGETEAAIAKMVAEGLSRPDAIRKFFSENPDKFPASA